MASTTRNNRRVSSRSEHNRRSRLEYYEDGNAVRKLEALPEETEHEARPAQRTRPETKPQHRANRAKAKSLSLGYVFFLTLMCAATLFSCIHFLQIQSKYIRQSESIASMESVLSKLKADNDAYYKQTLDSVDLEDVKEVAIEEFGMHYATESQVEYYSLAEESYVRQYKDL